MVDDKKVKKHLFFFKSGNLMLESKSEFKLLLRIDVDG